MIKMPNDLLRQKWNEEDEFWTWGVENCVISCLSDEQTLSKAERENCAVIAH